MLILKKIILSCLGAAAMEYCILLFGIDWIGKFLPRDKLKLRIVLIIMFFILWGILGFWTIEFL